MTELTELVEDRIQEIERRIKDLDKDIGEEVDFMRRELEHPAAGFNYASNGWLADKMLIERETLRAALVTLREMLERGGGDREITERIYVRIWRQEIEIQTLNRKIEELARDMHLAYIHNQFDLHFHPAIKGMRLERMLVEKRTRNGELRVLRRILEGGESK